MAIIINDGWDVAHHHIHEAFLHLGQAYSYNKHATQKYRRYEKDYHWAEYLGFSAEVRQLFIAENKLSIKATILFQAGIEAWISWAYTKPKLSAISTPRNFVIKWETAFSHLDSDYDFSTYADFYRQIRNPIVHPSNQSDVERVASVWCKPVHEGLKAGWTAMSVLSAELGYPFDENSWDRMFNINVTPESINNNEVSDLQALEREMLKKHLSGARGELGKE